MSTDELLAQIRELQEELINTRMEAEEAWDHYDKAVEREKRCDSCTR